MTTTIGESLPHLNFKEIAAAIGETAVHIRLGGTVVYDEPLSYQQGQPFANWARSNLSYTAIIGDTHPDDGAYVNRITVGQASSAVAVPVQA